jgi:hypothetical protein
VVTSVDGNKVTWKDEKTGKLIEDSHQDMEILMGNGGLTSNDSNCIKHRMPNGSFMIGPPHGPGQTCVEWSTMGGNTTTGGYSQGGMLVGPSHENGGIPAIVDGTEPIEVEGGEFVINAKTVEAVGEDFLHKLNSTSTPYHTGGYQQGQLPTPSQFRMGGKIDYKMKQKMQSGGMAGGKRKKMSINSRKMQMGGPVNTPRDKNKVSARARRRLKKSKSIRGRIGGVTSRISSLSANHTHTVTIDENGAGETIGGTHSHAVIGGVVQMTCPGNGVPCHSHE